MISDEERREVAAKMREIAHINPGWTLDSLIVAAIVSSTGALRQPISETLADLIDRPVTHNIAEHPGFKCKLCGDEWPLDIGFDYCPRCGAEVMERC